MPRVLMAFTRCHTREMVSQEIVRSSGVTCCRRLCHRQAAGIWTAPTPADDNTPAHRWCASDRRFMGPAMRRGGGGHAVADDPQLRYLGAMPIAFSPNPATILICDFDTGFRPPEMIKKRPVVVVSPRRRRSQLVTVVPLSSTAPQPKEPWHHELATGTYPPARGRMWAKCDVIATVGLDRLDRVKTKSFQGNRSYVTYSVPTEEFQAILACVRAALGLH